MANCCTMLFKYMIQIEKPSQQSTCIDPSPIPPAMDFPSRYQAHVVIGTLPGLASLGFMTYRQNFKERTGG